MFTAEEDICKQLIIDAIDYSINFEAFLEKTDFNSWIDKVDAAEKVVPDTEITFGSHFDQEAFRAYTKLVKDADEICNKFIDNNCETFIKNHNLNKVQFVKCLIHYLFKAKRARLEARRAFTTDVTNNKYVEAANMLSFALSCVPLNFMQKPLNGSREKTYDLLVILFYNDLSICYAGFKNSSMSRGFSEESLKLLNVDEAFITFKQNVELLEAKINDKLVKNQNYKDLSNLPFVVGKDKKYDLYTFALFCKGVAELRSFLKDESEKTFIQIIKLSNRYKCPKNSDYISTLLQYASLLNDLSRSKEAIAAIEQLEKLEKEKIINKMDIISLESQLIKASAFIDQSCFEEARKSLENLFDFKDIVKVKNIYSEPILDGLICYGRSFLEEAKNILPKEKGTGRSELLNNANQYFQEACNSSMYRKQKSLIQKSAKYMAEAYQINDDNENTLKYYSIAISEGAVDNFSNLLKDSRLDAFVSRCEDTDLLKGFSRQIFSSTHNRCKKDTPEQALCLKLLNKLKKECVEKQELWAAERAERRIEEIVVDQDCSEPYPLINETNFNECYEILIGKTQDDDVKFLTAQQIKARLDINEKSFDNVLFGRTGKAEKESLVELVVLRRWNSFSPGLSKKYALSLGGGYLLRIWAPQFQKMNNSSLADEEKDEQNSKSWFNLVIDPGYNFLLNFHNEDFRIEDIDAIVVTHSHPDHCAELSGIMDLISQVNKRRKKHENRKKVYLLLSRGVYKKFSPFIQDWKEQLKDVLLLEDNTKWPDKSTEFEIKSINTAHADLGGERAVGIVVKIKKGGNILLGFTGDTPWRNYVRDFFKKCDILCLHMGGIKNFEIGYGKDNKPFDSGCYEHIRKETKEVNHLLFYGSRDIITNCKPNALVIIGEFGEELKYGLRTDLVNKLNFSSSSLCIPADTGLYFVKNKIDTRIRCDFCNNFAIPKEIKIFPYGLIDSLHYICDACNCTLTESQKRTIVDHKLTRH